MARRLRLEFPGALYHVLSRGNRREDIFREDADRKMFLKTLGEAIAKTHWRVHAYCLMNNHFHLVLETPQSNLVVGMKWFLGTYTSRFNRRHKISGHLFGGRYKSLFVDPANRGHLKTVCDYVHLNPARAKLLGPKATLRDYPWSSFPSYLAHPSERPEWLQVERLLGEWGIPRDTPAGRQQFARRVEERRLEETPEEWKTIRHGWFLGDDPFRKELLEQMTTQLDFKTPGPELRQRNTDRADQIVEEELSRLGWTEASLADRKKGDPGKMQIALRLRAQTTLTVRQVTDRLKMGSRAHVSHLLYWHDKRKDKPNKPK